MMLNFKRHVHRHLITPELIVFYIGSPVDDLKNLPEESPADVLRSSIPLMPASDRAVSVNPSWMASSKLCAEAATISMALATDINSFL